MTSIIIDCTELYQNPIRTGIQRVVREILRHWPSEGPELHVSRFEHGRGLIRLSEQAVLLLSDMDPIATSLPYDDLVRRLQESSADLKARPLPSDALIFVPELFYDPRRCRFHEERLSARPESLALLMYDFLPYLQPSIFGIRSAAPLMHYLRLSRLTPHVSYISEQTRQDHQRRVLRKNGALHGPVLPLGADGLGLERQKWRPDRRSFVALGSIDGRKNQHLVAAAFVQLWKAGHDVPLTIVGRAFDGLDLGWVDEARQFPNFRWLNAASDEEVRRLLRNARATIYVSESEGFGLPPVESLAAGIPVIATDSCPSVAMLQQAGTIRLEAITSEKIAAAVLSLESDAAASELWADAKALQVGSWRDFAKATVNWLSALHLHRRLSRTAVRRPCPLPRLAFSPQAGS